MKPYSFDTKCVKSINNNLEETKGAITTPISLASTFIQIEPGNHRGFEYSRTGNPTRSQLELKIAHLENASYGLAFSSGMSAIMTIINLLKHGSAILCCDDVYGGTNRYFQRVLKDNNNITTIFQDLRDESAVKHIISSNKNVRMIWIETPSNPMLKIIDIEMICDLCKNNQDIIVVVDNTFATPFLQTPIDFGADIVVHSGTKYLNGHSDVVIGALATNSESFYESLKFLQNTIGAVPSPFDCYMCLRGIKTLSVRMEKQQKNAQILAEKLESHQKVRNVLYPGLKSHLGYKIAGKQMKGPGAIISVEIDGGKQECFRLIKNLKLFLIAESLGAVESLINFPEIMTHASVPEKQRELLGINSSLLRISVGLENVEDLWADLKNALDDLSE